MSLLVFLRNTMFIMKWKNKCRDKEKLAMKSWQRKIRLYMISKNYTLLLDPIESLNIRDILCFCVSLFFLSLPFTNFTPCIQSLLYQSRLTQVNPSKPKWTQENPIVQTIYKIYNPREPNCWNWFKLVLTVSDWFKLVQTGSNWFKLIQTGTN